MRKTTVKTPLRAIAKLRERDGITQAELASALKTTQQSVARWENGVADPSGKMLFALADFFDTSLDVLVGRAPVGKRPASIEEKLLEFKALDEGSPAAADVDDLTRQVFEEYKRDPELFLKKCRGIRALIDLDSQGGPKSLSDIVDAVVAA